MQIRKEFVHVLEVYVANNVISKSVTTTPSCVLSGDERTVTSGKSELVRENAFAQHHFVLFGNRVQGAC